MRTKPHAFVRRDDGEVFLLDKDGTYFNAKMRIDYPGHLQHAWSESAFDDRTTFRPVAKAEDLFAVQEACRLERAK